MDLAVAMRINTAATALMIILIPLMGWVSDRFVRRTKLIAIAIGLAAVCALPLHYWMLTNSLMAAITTQFLLAALVAVPCGVAPATFVELFPTADRLSGYSISFNLGLGIVGGSTPVVATWLIDVSGVEVAPAYYLVMFALMAIGGVLWMQDRSREPLL